MTKTTRTWAICIVLCLLSFFKLVAQDQTQYKEYSYTELFQMIADEEDSVFALSNAMIKFDEETDQRFILNLNENGTADFTSSINDSIRVDKALKLTNIVADIFGASGTISGIGKVIFSKRIVCTNCISFLIVQSTFNSTVTFRFNNQIKDFESLLPEYISRLLLSNSKFQSGLYISSFTDKRYLQLGIYGNVIHAKKEKNDFTIMGYGFQDIGFNNNAVKGSGPAWIDLLTRNQNQGDQKLFNLEIIDNEFNVPVTRLAFNDQNIDYVKINGNHWSDIIITEVSELDRVNTLIDGPALIGRLIDNETYGELYIRKNEIENDWYSTDNVAGYREQKMIEDVNIYNSEVALRGLFKDYFGSRHDAVSANLFYLEIKDLETRRLEYLYHQAPSFDSFFKWRINQFLKLFSAYGTEPAKAVTFSVNVIIAFAFVYLFFPNYWDSYGKSRLKHRFSFFYKYMSLNAGIQDVYLEENKAEIEDNEAFKSLLVAHKEQAPKLFFNLAMPLYRWSMAGTLTYAWLIKRFDFLKGTWKDTDAKTRGLKSFLIGTMFIIALLYDIFIKMLNALMLSINTFTTLGFGEIPIKGLPRYLAIIQGFIGWFMLTIFSVSLISQLLN